MDESFPKSEDVAHVRLTNWASLNLVLRHPTLNSFHFPWTSDSDIFSLVCMSVDLLQLDRRHSTFFLPFHWDQWSAFEADRCLQMIDDFSNLDKKNNDILTSKSQRLNNRSVFGQASNLWQASLLLSSDKPAGDLSSLQTKQIILSKKISSIEKTFFSTGKLIEDASGKRKRESSRANGHLHPRAIFRRKRQ